MPSTITIGPNGTLPQVTGWLPIAQSVTDTPLGNFGAWGAMPTLSLSNLFGTPDTVISIPMFAAGYVALLGLGQVGALSANVVLPTQNGVYSALSATLSNFSALGFTVTGLNVSNGNYIGTNGINLNNGQNIVVVQTPFTGALPLPAIFSLGQFDLGATGVGFTLPSLFGVTLLPQIQVGTTPSVGAAGIIPAGVLASSPLLPTSLVDVTGLLGLDPTIQNAVKTLNPVYADLITPIATPISNFLTQQYGPVFDNVASGVLNLATEYNTFANDVTTGLGTVSALNPLAALAAAPAASSALTLALSGGSGGLGAIESMVSKDVNSVITGVENLVSTKSLTSLATSATTQQTVAAPQARAVALNAVASPTTTSGSSTVTTGGKHRANGPVGSALTQLKTTTTTAKTDLAQSKSLAPGLTSAITSKASAGTSTAGKTSSGAASTSKGGGISHALSSVGQSSGSHSSGSHSSGSHGSGGGSHSGH